MRPIPDLPSPVELALDRARGHIISSRQLNALGVESWRISDWVRAGRLERVVVGWYRRPGDTPPLQDAHLAQACLRLLQPRSPVVMSGAAGLRAAGVPVGVPGPTLALVQHGRRMRLPDHAPFTTAQRLDLHRLATVKTSGLRCAEPGVLLADTVTGLPDDEVRSLLYASINALRLSPVELVTCWAQMDHEGARRLRQLAREGVLEHESPAEWSLYDRLFRTSPPPPDCQVWLAPNIRVDFVFLFAALVIEYYGEKPHADRVDADATRVYALRRMGNEVLVVTKSMTRDLPALGRHIHEVRRRREDLMLRGQLRRPTLPPQPGPRITPLRTLVPGG